MKYIIDIPDLEKYTMPSALHGRILGVPVSVGKNTYTMPTDIVLEGPYKPADQMQVENNDINLCKSCKYDYPDCPTVSQDVLFGDGKDNICCCNSYNPYLTHGTMHRKIIENEVWEFAKQLLSYSGDEWREIENALLVKKYTYQEAKEKYKEWKQDRDRIKIGDEVVNHLDKTKIIFAINEDKDIAYGADFSRYPVASEAFSLCKAKKTGRHFPQISDLLEKMKEESE